MEKLFSSTDFLDEDFSFLMKVFEGWWNEDSDRFPSWAIINSGLKPLLVDLHIVPHIADINTPTRVIGSCHGNDGQVTIVSKTMVELLSTP